MRRGLLNPGKKQNLSPQHLGQCTQAASGLCSVRLGRCHMTSRRPFRGTGRTPKGCEGCVDRGALAEGGSRSPRSCRHFRPEVPSAKPTAQLVALAAHSSAEMTLSSQRLKAAQGAVTSQGVRGFLSHPGEWPGRPETRGGLQDVGDERAPGYPAAGRQAPHEARSRGLTPAGAERTCPSPERTAWEAALGPRGPPWARPPVTGDAERVPAPGVGGAGDIRLQLRRE